MRASMIVISNRGPDEWLATFADPVRAPAAIDRFTSNAYDLVIAGESYRPRQMPTCDRRARPGRSPARAPAAVGLPAAGGTVLIWS